MPSAYRDNAKDNVVPIRPDEEEAPPKPPRIWPWVMLALLAGETAIAYGTDFRLGAFVYMGMLNVVVLAFFQAFLANERRLEIAEAATKKKESTAALDNMAMGLLEDTFHHANVIEKKYEKATSIEAALKIRYPLISQGERNDVERRISKVSRGR